VQEHVAAGVLPAQRANPADLDARQKELRKQIHDTIAKVSDDVGRRYTFNTAIAAVMELVNAVGRYAAQDATDRALVQEALESTVLLLAPIAPHICHSLWHALGHTSAIVDSAWQRLMSLRALPRVSHWWCR
jgi:leucyl-tRNA synthetase